MRCRRTTLIYQQWWYYIWLSGSHNLPQLCHVQDVDKAALYVSRQTLWPSLCIVLPKQVIFLEQSFFSFSCSDCYSFCSAFSFVIHLCYYSRAEFILFLLLYFCLCYSSLYSHSCTWLFLLHLLIPFFMLFFLLHQQYFPLGSGVEYVDNEIPETHGRNVTMTGL